VHAVAFLAFRIAKEFKDFSMILMVLLFN